MTFKKYQIKYFIIILLVTSVFTVHTLHSICQLRFFCSWVDGKDQNKNDFLKVRIDLGVKRVSMFDPTRKHNTNPIRVFSGYGWALMGLGYKRVDSKTTQ